MWLLPKIFARSDDETPPTGSTLETANEKSVTDNKAATTTAQVNSGDYDYDSSDEPQPGVEKMEAVAKVWSRNHIIITYVLLVHGG